MRPSPIQHLWSLAIEEQVYLVVPLVVAGCLRLGRGRRGLLAGLARRRDRRIDRLGVVLSHGVYSNRVYLGTDTRLAEITIGALAAMRARRTRTHRRARRRTTRAFDVLALGACGLVLALWTSLDLHSDFLFRGGFAIHALAIVIVIGVVTRPFGLLRGCVELGTAGAARSALLRRVPRPLAGDAVAHSRSDCTFPVPSRSSCR